MKSPLEEIDTYLRSFDNTTVVIGLDGYSGLGKTTISNGLVKKNKNIRLLHLDDYVVTSNTKEKLETQMGNNMEHLKLEWTDVNGKGFDFLVNEINTFRKNENPDKNILLIDGVFFFHPDVLHGCFDRVIFLSGNEKNADDRRVKREKERWGDNYFPETNPDSYARLFKLAWVKYKELYNPAINADLVVKVKI